MVMKINISTLCTAMLMGSIACLLISCGDIQQDLYLKADGSGKLEASFEMGEMMSMMKGFTDVNMSDVTLEEGATPDTIKQDPLIVQDPMEALMARITDPAHATDFDTLISIVSMMPDSLKSKQTRPDLTRHIWLRIQSPALSDELTVGMVIEFKDHVQLQHIINHLDTMEGSAMAMPGPGGAGAAGAGFPNELFLTFHSDMKTGAIKIDTVDYGSIKAEMDMGMMMGDSASTSEDMGIMEMMFGNSKIRTIIHVPGEVLSCSNKDAILTKDNRVIVEHEFMEVMKSGKVPGYEIKFTPKK
jgi:hypothetical protein